MRELGHEQLPDRFVDALSAASPPPEKIRAAIKRLQDSVAAWWHVTDDLKAFLPLDALPGIGQPLEECSLSALLRYAKDLQAALNQFAGLADPVLRTAKSQPPDAVTFVADLREAESLRKQETLDEKDSAKWASRFGPAFQGLTTDWPALRKALTWTIRVREHFAAASPDWQPKAADHKTAAGAIPAGAVGVPPSSFVQLATSPNQTVASAKDLRHAQELMTSALHSFEIRFEPPAPQVAGKALGALAMDALKKRLGELRERAGELSDWIDWQTLAKRFEHLGLAAFWADLQAVRPSADQLVNTLVKAALTSWVDRIFQDDPILGGFRRQEHERVLDEFRELDRQLLRLNAERVAAAADARRPQATEANPGGQIAILLREAHKKSRHLPVRRLFEEIADLLLQLKPCMLMSPLSVCQFLDPARVQFDVVVFDEASQIRPEDAIGAILRGKQVVITGDDKQLPPTNFFQQLGDDDLEDDLAAEQEPANFESVLDACLGAGLRPHLLRWHYRSRHEGLIAYSNLMFYDNKLITFPGPLTGAEAVGVEFRHVADGVYDRGAPLPRQCPRILKLSPTWCCSILAPTAPPNRWA